MRQFDRKLKNFEKIYLHVGYSDTLGGASIAMMRLHSSLRNAGISSKVLVAQKLSTDQDVIGPIKKSEKYFNELKIKIARQKNIFISMMENTLTH